MISNLQQALDMIDDSKATRDLLHAHGANVTKLIDQIRKELLRIQNTTDYKNASKTRLYLWVGDSFPIPFSPLAQLLFKISEDFNGKVG